MSRLRILNPNVVINTYPDSDTPNTDDTDTNIVKAINDEFISKFDLLCATGCSQDELVSKQYDVFIYLPITLHNNLLLLSLSLSFSPPSLSPLSLSPSLSPPPPSLSLSLPPLSLSLSPLSLSLSLPLSPSLSPLSPSLSPLSPSLSLSLVTPK